MIDDVYQAVHVLLLIDRIRDQEKGYSAEEYSRDKKGRPEYQTMRKICKEEGQVKVLCKD